MGVLEVVMSRLANPLANLRCSAVQSLGELAMPGDVGVLIAMQRCLEDTEAEVRAAGAEAIAKLAARGDVAAIDALSNMRHTHHDASVRAAAVAGHGLGACPHSHGTH